MIVDGRLTLPGGLGVLGDLLLSKVAQLRLLLGRENIRQLLAGGAENVADFLAQRTPVGIGRHLISQGRQLLANVVEQRVGFFLLLGREVELAKIFCQPVDHHARCGTLSGRPSGGRRVVSPGGGA